MFDTWKRVYKYTINLWVDLNEEIPLIQSKAQRLCFAGAAVKRHPMPKVRETQVKW